MASSTLPSSTDLTATPIELPESNFAFDVAVTSMNIILSLTATLGNAIIIGALRRDTAAMRGPSKLLLGSLALSDLCVGSVMHPLVTAVVVSNLTGSAQSGQLAWTLLRPTGNYLYAVSLLTITSISVDRFLAVHLTVRYQSVVTVRRVGLALLAVWLTPALVLAAVRPSTVDELDYHVLNAVYITVGIAVPSVLYLMIYNKLRHHQSVVQAAQLDAAYTFNTAKYKKSVHSMLVVYIALLLCYTPSLILTIAALVDSTSKSLLVASQFTFVLVMLNSTLNPALYCWRIRELRKLSLDQLKQLRSICC